MTKATIRTTPPAIPPAIAAVLTLPPLLSAVGLEVADAAALVADVEDVEVDDVAVSLVDDSDVVEDSSSLLEVDSTEVLVSVGAEVVSLADAVVRVAVVRALVVSSSSSSSPESAVLVATDALFSVFVGDPLKAVDMSLAIDASPSSRFCRGWSCLVSVMTCRA